MDNANLQPTRSVQGDWPEPKQIGKGTGMISLKGIAEDGDVALVVVRAVRNRISSWAQALLIASLVVFALLIGAAAYLDSLIADEAKNVAINGRSLDALNDDHNNRIALDYIDQCMNTNKYEAKLHPWYCTIAEARYMEVSAKMPQDHVKEVIAKQAYGAMRIDVEQYLRSAEIDRRISAPHSREKEILMHLQNKVIVWGVAILSIVLLLGIYLPLRPPEGDDGTSPSEQLDKQLRLKQERKASFARINSIR